MKPDTNALLDCAIRAAQAAGNHALGNVSRRGEQISVSAHDVKLKLDVECQAHASSVIRASFPSHRILGEEGDHSGFGPIGPLEFLPAPAGAKERDEEFTWIVDPIDGTVNFSRGLPLWCSSVAVAAGNRVVAGAVFAPETGSCFSSANDRPAERNGKPLRVSGTEKLSDSIVTTGMDRAGATGHKDFRFVEAIAGSARKTRVMGCAALDLCMVAEGVADAYFEAGIFSWDIAAAGLIVRQAGGKCETLAVLKQNRFCFLGSNGLVHAEMKNILQAAMAGC